MNTTNIVVKRQLAEMEKRARKEILLNPKENSEFIRMQREKREMEKLRKQINNSIHMFR